MNILIAYDVNTETKEGQKRLRRVAKTCEGFGQRVQLSVFECTLSDTNLERLRSRLLKIIDASADSLRIYTLRGKREEVVEVHGRDLYEDPMEPKIA